MTMDVCRMTPTKSADLALAVVEAACALQDADPNKDITRQLDALERAVAAWRKHLRKSGNPAHQERLLEAGE